MRVMSKVMSKAMKSKTPQLTVRNLVTLPNPLCTGFGVSASLNALTGGEPMK